MSIRCTRLAQAIARARPAIALGVPPLQRSAAAFGSAQARSISDWKRKGSAASPPKSRENPAHGIAPSRDEHIGGQRFADFDLADRVCIVTGAAQGLGLALAEGLVEAGANGKQSLPFPSPAPSPPASRTWEAAFQKSPET